MKTETTLLNQIRQLQLPAQVRPDGATPAELEILKGFFAPGGPLIGNWLPDHRGTGIAMMEIRGFRE